jgi:hypothetical protein
VRLARFIFPDGSAYDVLINPDLEEYDPTEDEDSQLGGHRPIYEEDDDERP